MAFPTEEELIAEMAAIDAKKRAMATLLLAMREYEATVSGLEKPKEQGRGSVGGRRSPVMDATEKVAIELMDEANGPVPTARVVEEMQRRGIELPSKNVTNVISARLSNSGKFTGRRGYGYWFANRPWPSDDLETLLPDTVQTEPGKNEIDT